MLDFIVIGAGFAGCTMAYELNKAGAKIILLEKNDYIGGHAATEVIDDIIIHKFGLHQYHTSDHDNWNFIRQFGEFNDHRLKVRVKYEGKLYSFPINLLTIAEVFGRAVTPEEAKKLIKSDITVDHLDDPPNFEYAARQTIGDRLYKVFMENYSRKQWGVSPDKIDAKVFSRLPVRYNFDDNYFLKHNGKYQGIPINGYTPLMENMLTGITVHKEVDFLKDKDYWRAKADKIIFTGPIDSYFDYSLGRLPYRSLRFEFERHEVPDYQGGPLVNYTDMSVNFTRIVEHKHMMCDLAPKNHTIISKEYATPYKNGVEPFYPINNKENDDLAVKYKELAKTEGVIIGGRLGLFKYFDMNQIIDVSRNLSKKLILNQ